MSDSLTPSRPPAWPRQAPWLRQVLAFGLFLFGGGALGWLAGRALPDISDEAAPDLPLVIAVALLSVFGAIALHELGHVLGMLAANFRVLLYVVGPLKISREGDRLRLRLNRDLALAGGHLFIHGWTETVIVKAGTTFEVVGVCPHEESMSNLLFVKDRIYLRGLTHLWCLGTRP